METAVYFKRSSATSNYRTFAAVMNIEACILAGGKGTRLGELTKFLPKPLVEIAGKPVIAYQLEWLKASGVERVHIFASYLSKEIYSFCGSGEKWGLTLQYHEDTQPLGTAGALRQISGTTTAHLLVLYGDIIVNFSLQKFVDFFSSKTSSLGAIIVHPNNHPLDSDLLEVDDEERIIHFHPKPHKNGEVFHNLVSAGVYLLAPSALKYIPSGYQDFGHDVFPHIVRQGGKLYAYRSAEYFHDMGTPERLHRVEKDIMSGVFNQMNCDIPQKAIFLDRDGVLIEEVDELSSVDELRILDAAFPALKKINSSAYLAIVITNQPMIAKGKLTFFELDTIHKTLETKLGLQGVKIDDLFYCPHHPEKGFPGEVAELKIHCDCRKPGIGLIQRAQAKYNLDLVNSYLIGDSTTDVQAALNAGIQPILVKTGYGGKDRRFPVPSVPTYSDVEKAVERILS